MEKPSILVVLGRLTSSECADLTSTTNHTKVLGHSNQPIWDISNEMSKDWGLGLTCALWFPPISTKSHCAHKASEQTLYVAERTESCIDWKLLSARMLITLSTVVGLLYQIIMLIYQHTLLVLLQVVHVIHNPNEDILHDWILISFCDICIIVMIHNLHWYQ